MEEKRRTARAEKVLIVQYAQSSSDPSRSLIWDSSTIKNISTDGILFNSNKLFAKNEKLQLRFKIPVDPFNYLEAAGEVVGASANKIRIKFIDLDDRQKKVIGEYVESLLKKEDKS
jgi:hypothetical protein